MKQILPSVPLITCDPYFSIWSNTNSLNDDDTVLWTGVTKPIKGVITIDNQEYCFMGKSDVKNIEQTNLEVTATMSKYTFKNEKMELKVIFSTPLLLEDLNLISRPTSYIKFETNSLDSNEHDVKVNVQIDELICYDVIDENERKNVHGGVHILDNCKTAWIGQKRQMPLSHSGDGTAIDWGYAYIATDLNQEVAFVEDERNVICANISMKAKDKATIVVAYDDINSIQYFGDVCKGYWADEGKTILQAISETFEEEILLEEKCSNFDKELQEIAVKTGGESYHKICVAGYRQAIAAHKLIKDREGNAIFISKECFSNGCAGTVDVSYPSVPLFLIYQPELVKAMIRPIFKYSKMPVWEYDFAPHDIGRYPYAWGQVYALKNKLEKREVYEANYMYPKGSDIFDFTRQMPVEECGNMLIMTAALMKYAEDIEFIKEQMPLFDKWVNYLVEFGADPGDQLCTDDFAGHLAHNINLAAKAILGIEAYSILQKILGNTEKSKKYHEIAKIMAKDWEKNSLAGEHTMLAFGEKETWSLKYNIIWDKVFESELFTKETYEREINWYISKTNKYGVPLDSRSDYTKTDWIMWVASFSDDSTVIESFANPLALYLQDATKRTPFSDWIFTSEPTQRGFQNRTVQGGLFMPMLVNSYNNVH